mmetsp:Transcript_5259/g.11114  ORF Transcript_5259/g.11114 Transcript_5259/m.11114 type:complete len:455 (-) Transcript_5259:419-1783(-)
MTEEDHKSNDKSPPQVLELAATFRLDDVGYGRDDHGRLKDWQKWAESHPHKNEHVQVCHGREEWEIQNDEMSPNKNSVSVVSWNTLSDTWYETGDYQHTPREVGIWEGRFPIFMEWIKRLRPHVLALQEVDFQIFDSHYLPALQSMGYHGMMQSQKKQNQPCGVATFWRSDLFQVLAHRSFSRSMALHLQRVEDVENGNKGRHHFCLINVHLESSQTQDGAEKRARQLNSPLQWASARSDTVSLQDSVCPVILCGDFNTGADAALFHALRTHQWHGHSLASVYEHVSTSDTLPVNRATFAVPGHHYLIDHLLYSHAMLKPRFVLNALTPSEIDEYLGPSGSDRGFPNGLCPSDHLPIGCVFEMQHQESATVSLLNGETKDSEATTLSETRSQEIRYQWQNLLAQKPYHGRGKPSPEELAKRKEYAEKVKLWKAGFEQNDAEVAFVAKITKKGKE